MYETGNVMSPRPLARPVAPYVFMSDICFVICGGYLSNFSFILRLRFLVKVGVGYTRWFFTYFE